MRTISQSEKTDILLALAMAFEKKFAAAENREPVETARVLAEDFFGALTATDFESLKSRAELLDSLPPENRETWSETRLEKIRGRGQTKRLDENINPSQMVGVLSREPKAIQYLILRNLPPDLSRRISLYLDLNFLPAEPPAKNASQIDEEIVALVRQKIFIEFYRARRPFRGGRSGQIFG
jgi:hypothetical protein